MPLKDYYTFQDARVYTKSIRLGDLLEGKVLGSLKFL